MTTISHRCQFDQLCCTGTGVVLSRAIGNGVPNTMVSCGVAAAMAVGVVAQNKFFQHSSKQNLF